MDLGFPPPETLFTGEHTINNQFCNVICTSAPRFRFFFVPVADLSP